MDSQNTVKKAEEFFNIKGETPLDPFAVDIFGGAKSVQVEENNTPSEVEEEAEKTKERSAWNANLPGLTAREVEFSRLLQNLPKNLTRRAAAAVEDTLASYTFQLANDIKCRLASVSEVNLAEAIDKRGQTPQVFLTLGCQPENAAAVIALNADFASLVIDLILGGQAADFAASRELSPIENVIIEFLGINILSEINNWLGQPVLCLQKVAGENSPVFDPFERGAESVFGVNFNAFAGTVTVFSGWSFLDGLDKTQNPLFEKKSPDKQLQTFKKIALKLGLRLPIGTTYLTADNLLYLEPNDVVLIEEPENAWAGDDFSGNLQVYVGSGKNFLLNGISVPDETDGGGELIFKINEILSSEERQKLTPTKLKMDEKETQETEIAGEDTPEESEQTLDAAEETENAAILSNVLVNLRVEIAGGKISLNELQNLRSGQVISLGCRPTDPVRIVTDSSDQPIALGELVDIEGKLGVRVTRVFI
jgi:type III secretion protein Q